MSDPRSDAPERAERRSRLLGIKLRALVADHLGGAEFEPATFPGGVAGIADGAAWVLVDEDARVALGRALAWALRKDARALHLIAEDETGLLARRAARFDFPIDVWFPEGRLLLPAPAIPLAPPAEPLPSHLALTGLIEAAGATPNVEHGVVFGEVRGLEVCRVVDQPTVGHIAELAVPELAAIDELTADDDGVEPGVLLEVGVGANDREAFQLLHGDVPTVEALRGVVAAVETHRSPDAPQHPLNRLALERMLRWRAERDPSLLGLRSLRPAQPPVPRPNLKDPTPCVADGIDHEGRLFSVVFSSGVDLDLAPFLADVCSMSDRSVVAALPRRDLVPLTRELIELLADDVRLVALD